MFEYELLDTGIFDEDRYWISSSNMRKPLPNDLCIRLEAVNRGPEPAEFHCIPQLWFRNNWPPTATADARPAYQLPGFSRGNYFDAAMTRDPCRWRISVSLCARGNLLPGAAFRRSPVYGQRIARTAPRPANMQKTASTDSSFTVSQCVNPDRFGTKACIHYREDDSSRRIIRLATATDKEPSAGSAQRS